MFTLSCDVLDVAEDLSSLVVVLLRNTTPGESIYFMNVRQCLHATDITISLTISCVFSILVNAIVS